MNASAPSRRSVLLVVYVTACGLGACTSATEPSKPLTSTARIFVAVDGQTGIYTQVAGQIELTCDEVVVDVDGHRSLYARSTVRRLELDESASPQLRQLVDRCWVPRSLSQNESAFVEHVTAGLKQVPLAGAFLAELFDSLHSQFVRMIMAVVILVVLLTYLSYQAYIGLVVATNLRHLNTDKLSMEVKKLKYDIGEIEQKLGLIQSTPPSPALAASMPGRPSSHLDVPFLQVGGFVKYKILRVLTAEEKARRLAEWRNTWTSKRNRRRRSLAYVLRLVMYVIAYTFAVCGGLGSFVDIFMSYVEPELGPGMMPVFIVLFVLLCAAVLRLHTTLRIMRAAYKQVVSEEKASMTASV